MPLNFIGLGIFYTYMYVKFEAAYFNISKVTVNTYMACKEIILMILTKYFMCLLMPHRHMCPQNSTRALKIVAFTIAYNTHTHTDGRQFLTNRYDSAKPNQPVTTTGNAVRWHILFPSK